MDRRTLVRWAMRRGERKLGRNAFHSQISCAANGWGTQRSAQSRPREEHAMAIRVVRLGSPREANEGIRIGTVRRPPRGVPRTSFAKLDFYDTWLPQLAPSAELVTWARAIEDSAANWKVFEKRYVRELSSPDNQRLLDLLATLSQSTDFSIGCYCEDERKCHRSFLRKMLLARGALIK